MKPFAYDDYLRLRDSFSLDFDEQLSIKTTNVSGALEQRRIDVVIATHCFIPEPTCIEYTLINFFTKDREEDLQRQLDVTGVVLYMLRDIYAENPCAVYDTYTKIHELNISLDANKIHTFYRSRYGNGMYAFMKEYTFQDMRQTMRDMTRVIFFSEPYVSNLNLKLQLFPFISAIDKDYTDPLRWLSQFACTPISL